MVRKAVGMTPNRRKFATYVKDRERMAKQALSAIQKEGPAAALETCRALANEIESDLYEKKPDHFFDISWLAEFQLCLERAVSVLDKNVTQVASLSVSGNEVDHFDHGIPAAGEGRGV